MKLRDLIDTIEFSGELYHNEYEVDVASVEELSLSSLTSAGIEKWDNVLNAKVDSIHDGVVVLSGVNYRALEKFTYALAGYVSETDYSTWFKHKEA